MSATEPLSKTATATLGLLYNFFLDTPACISDEEENNSKDHVTKFNLSKLLHSADSLGQKHFQNYCFFYSTFCLFILLVSATETGK